MAGNGRQLGAFGEKKKTEIAEARERQALYGGVTISDLVYIFHMDRRSIMGKIGTVKPCGTGARGAKLYQIGDVAPYLVKPVGDIEDIIRRMRPNDLPPNLSKEFWNGQNSRLKWEEQNGDLWRTDRVVEVFSGACKTIRMSMLLIPDTLERKTSLTDAQRDEINELIGKTLERVRANLTEQFAGEDGENDHGAAIAFDEAFDPTFDAGESAFGGSHFTDDEIFGLDESEQQGEDEEL